MNDKFWMRQALELAKKAMQLDEVPVGAIIINAAGGLISSGYNQMISQHDPTAHAEIIALREAAKKIKNYRLTGSTIYVTLEPCLMCAAALVHARINRLVIATRDLERGAAGSVFNIINNKNLNYSIQLDEGVLQEESALLLQEFFLNKRKSL